MSSLRLITSNLIHDLTKSFLVMHLVFTGSLLCYEIWREACASFTKGSTESQFGRIILVGDYFISRNLKALELLFQELPGAEIRIHKSSGILLSKGLFVCSRNNN